MKEIIGLTIIAALLIFATTINLAQASGNHHNPAPNVTYEHYSTLIIPQSFTQRAYEQTSGTALAISKAQLICDGGTRKTQVSVGVGAYDGSEAVSFGGCKSINNFTIKGSVGREGGTTGYGAGMSWKF